MSDPIQAMQKVENLNAIGVELLNKREYDPARLHFLAALYLVPDQPQVWQNLGAVLRAMGHNTASLAAARRSVALAPNNPFCKSNLGVALMATRQYGKALAILREVCEALPTSGPSWHNLGLSHYMMGDYAEAFFAFEKAQTLGYEPAQLRSDKSLTLLALGLIEPGLEEYEVRWDIIARSTIWDLNIPEWKGENLVGKRILVHHEQGFGDSLMLVRFVNNLWQTYHCDITIAVPGALVELFKASFRFATIVDWDETEKLTELHVDFHSPMLSLMRWLRITSVSRIDSEPYLEPNFKSLVRLPQGKLKVGLCWASGNHGPQLAERRRVINLTEFLPLMELPDVSLVSLQKGNESGEIELNGLQGLVFDSSAYIDDFADTANIMSELDLVISVDSAVAHLAGAMGKPCLMLSPFTRCWRWWYVTSGLPWYENMQVFYQSEDGSWNKAVAQAIGVVRQLLTDE